MSILSKQAAEKEAARQGRQEDANLPYAENLGAAGRCADTRMLLRALKQRWPIPAEIRKFLPEWMAAVIQNERLSFRERTAAAKILLEVEKLNLADEELAKVQPREDKHVHFHGSDLFAEIATAAAVIRKKSQDSALDIADAQPPGQAP
jgi:hypothetical protein